MRRMNLKRLTCIWAAGLCVMTATAQEGLKDAVEKVIELIL